MSFKIYFSLIILLLVSACFPNSRTFPNNSNSYNQTYPIQVDSLNLFDEARKRSIPVALYFPKTDKPVSKQKLIIFSHGYGGNKGGDNVAYSYLTEKLASKGYCVASIQHELTTDEPIAATGDFKITRRPNWERGVQNILYVLKEFKN